MKLRPARQLPSGAMRASGMLMRPVWPVALGVSACASGIDSSAAAKTKKRVLAFKKERPLEGVFSELDENQWCVVVVVPQPPKSPGRSRRPRRARFPPRSPPRPRPAPR